jgi:hypothetical protein
MPASNRRILEYFGLSNSVQITTKSLLHYLWEKYKKYKFPKKAKKYSEIDAAGIINRAIDYLAKHFLKQSGPFITGSWVNEHILWEKILEMRRFDILPHFLKHRYRQHFMHREKGTDDYVTVRDYFEEKYTTGWWTLDHIWWLICLLHDHAGPISIYYENRDLFLKLNRHYGTKIQELFSYKHETGFISIELEEIIKDNLERRERMLDEVLESNKEIDQLNVLWKKANEKLKKTDDESGEKIRTTLFKEHFIHPDYSKDLVSFIYLRDDPRGIFDHGLLAAMNFISLHEQELPLYNNLEPDNIAQRILTPIAMHNIYNWNSEDDPKREYDLEVDFAEHGDVFFLKLIDQLQEWGRCIKIKNQMHIESDRIFLSPTITYKGKKCIDLENLTVTYVFDNKDDALVETGWELEEFKKDKINKFRTLKLNKEPLNIKVQVIVKADFIC